MNRNSYLWLTLTAVLSYSVTTQAFTDQTAETQTIELRQQLDEQGQLLLDKLHEAREMGLKGDHFAMTYSLREAQRLVSAMKQADELYRDDKPAGQAQETTRQSGETSGVELIEQVEIDSPLPDGQMQLLDELEQSVGSIQLSALKDAVDQALQDLGTQPPTMGAALIATQQALEEIHWRNDVEVEDWVKARDLLIRGYGHLLDRDRQANSELRQAGELLSRLPYGRSYAQRLYQTLQAPTPDLAGLRIVIQALDNKILVSRMSAERRHLEGRGPNQ